MTPENRPSRKEISSSKHRNFQGRTVSFGEGSFTQPFKISWWFQPISKILVKLDHFPTDRGGGGRCLSLSPARQVLPYFEDFHGEKIQFHPKQSPKKECPWKIPNHQKGNDGIPTIYFQELY